MMKYVIFVAIAFLSAICAEADSKIRVIDATDNNPVIGATVIDKSGIIMGITDNNGVIAVANINNFPITIRYIGYEPVTTSADQTTVKLNPSALRLNEIVVTPGDRPIQRVVCFAREYSSGITDTDTIQTYCEYMTVAFIADGKVKGYSRSDAKPSARGTKRYARIAKNDTDSIFSPKRDDDVTALSWFDLIAFMPDKKITLPEAIKNGAETDTVAGKYGPKFIYRKKNNLFSKTADVLSDHKNRIWSPFFFKLLGMTIDIDAGSWTLTFADNGTESYGIHDFICGTYNIHLIGKGKWLKSMLNTKHPIEMNTYLEMYPVEITNCTVNDYKELRDDYSRIPFRYPADIRPLSPAIKALVERIDSEARQ